MKRKRVNAIPSIRAMFSDEEMARIEEGPLAATSGRGKQAWLHNVAMKAVEEAECATRS